VTPKEKAIYDRAYRERNRDRIAARRRASRPAINDNRRDWYDRNRDRQNAYMREVVYPKRRDRVLDGRIMKLYGLTLTDYRNLLAKQEGGCAICHTSNPGGSRGRFCVDHDHKTGRVRGLLCQSCNRAIGLLGDDANRLIAAAAYLR